MIIKLGNDHHHIISIWTLIVSIHILTSSQCTAAPTLFKNVNEVLKKGFTNAGETLGLSSKPKADVLKKEQGWGDFGRHIKVNKDFLGGGQPSNLPSRLMKQVKQVWNESPIPQRAKSVRVGGSVKGNPSTYSTTWQRMKGGIIASKNGLRESLKKVSNFLRGFRERGVEMLRKLSSRKTSDGYTRWKPTTDS